MALWPEFHDSLPDTPPPQAVERLVGHGALLETLLADHAAGRLHHAMMLAGEPGIGKATLAFAFARNIHAAVSGQEAVDKIAAGTHPSVHLVTRSRPEPAKPFRTTIAIDDVHRMSHVLSHTAGGEGPRIIIVDSAGDMNMSAANAMLKNLEEPPRNTHFFLIVQAGERILPTIRSRCRLMRVPALSEAEVCEALTGIGFDAEEAALCAASAGGSVREAILQARFGGVDLAAAVDALSASAFSPSRALAIAQAVSDRESGAQYDVLMAMLARRIAGRARDRAQAGAADAAALAELHADMARQRSVAEAFNLDRRLEVMNLLRRIHPVLAGA